jgi:hypothetical protein
MEGEGGRSEKVEGALVMESFDLNKGMLGHFTASRHPSYRTTRGQTLMWLNSLASPINKCTNSRGADSGGKRNTSENKDCNLRICEEEIYNAGLDE